MEGGLWACKVEARDQLVVTTGTTLKYDDEIWLGWWWWKWSRVDRPQVFFQEVKLKELEDLDMEGEEERYEVWFLGFRFE